MKRRTAWLLIGSLAVVCLGLVLSVAYPFSTAEPHAAKAPDERFSVGDADAFSASGRIVADGETALAFDGIVTADGAWYQRVVEEHVTSTEYHPGTGETVHQRLQFTGQERAERYRQEIAEDAALSLVRETSDGTNVTFVVTRNGTGGDEPVSGTAAVFVNSLSTAGYERTGTNSPNVTTYEPRSGWYEGQRPYRITSAIGTVQANPETMTVRAANVSWDQTVPAGSFAEYTLVTVASDAPTKRTITFEYTRGETELEQPTWVGDTGGGSRVVGPADEP